MKAVILHGTGSNHKGNWFPWLKKELEILGFEVWTPDLPNSQTPDLKAYNDFLFSSAWDFNDNLVIGHSSGAVAVMGLLQALPSNTKVNTAILAGIYRGNLGREDLNATNIDFDYEKIKQKARQFIFVHSDDDPVCPIDDAKWIAGQVGANVEVLHGLKHLDVDMIPRLTQFPELLGIIKQKVMQK